MAWSYLYKATKKMKKWATIRRRSVGYQVGDLVFVKIILSQHKYTCGPHKGIVRCHKGPFLIIMNVGKVAYKAKLPSMFKLHLVFHVCYLKPFHEYKEDPSRGKPKRTLMGMKATYDKDMERIVVDHML